MAIRQIFHFRNYLEQKYTTHLLINSSQCKMSTSMRYISVNKAAVQKEYCCTNPSFTHVEFELEGIHEAVEII